MSRTAFGLVLALALPAAELSAQEQFLGEWDVSIQTGRGSFSQSFAFMMEEGVLKGTVTTQQGTNDLTEVSFEEGTLRFTVVLTFQNNSISLAYTATVEGDEMKGTISGGRGGRGGGPTEFTGTRRSG